MGRSLKKRTIFKILILETTIIVFYRALFSMCFCMSVTIFTYDRLDCIWKRNLMIGVTKSEMVISQFIVVLLILSIAFSIMAVSFVLISSIKIAGNYISIILVLFLVIVCAIFGAIFISFATDTYRSALMVSNGVLFCLFFTSGKTFIKKLTDSFIAIFFIFQDRFGQPRHNQISSR
jgi:hypothetical protein